jgi:hypothetical protein
MRLAAPITPALRSRRRPQAAATFRCLVDREMAGALVLVIPARNSPRQIKADTGTRREDRTGPT